MPLLTAKEILEAKDLQFVEVEIPEWGGSVQVHQLSAGEMLSFTDDSTPKEDGMYLILVYCVKTQDGERMFTVSDIPGLRKKNLDVLTRLQQTALRVNGIGKDAESATKKGSGEGVTDASPIVSPEN